VTLCNLVEICHCVRGTCSIWWVDSADGGNVFLQNIGYFLPDYKVCTGESYGMLLWNVAKILPDYTTHPTGQYTSVSSPWKPLILCVFLVTCCGPDRQHPRKYEICSLIGLVFAVDEAVGATCKHRSRVFRYDLNPSKICLFTWQLQFLNFYIILSLKFYLLCVVVIMRNWLLAGLRIGVSAS
jgi:hypothetical protein